MLGVMVWYMGLQLEVNTFINDLTTRSSWDRVFKQRRIIKHHYLINKGKGIKEKNERHSSDKQ